ncbi:hypothetical protein EOPP23_09085 [Endozoicomonas sp. OPT23]|uniref:LuxR C-terminal-related transcriptional regulator n=1 Tax=Endozoicomonas sp. OPT23 TaxID=2072845 RepID=UPI00129BBB60|nr:LuxR C-terminal-related transcriptional regulator [Endozoicomonas sp. OPT23]MRI33136.1 hypothetical protein [Endozoicomonas sp. OPT23]
MEPSKKIFLLCEQKTVQNSALVSLLSEFFHIQQTTLPSFSRSTECQNAIILLDTPELTDKLHTFLVSMSGKIPAPVIALLNVSKLPGRDIFLEHPGLKGLFLDTDSVETLVRGINSLIAGDYYLPTALVEALISKAPAQSESSIQLCDSGLRLTRREKQILSLAKTGATNHEIADQLHLSENTIKTHLYNLYRKLNVRNRIEAIEWARRHLAEAAMAPA